MQWIQWGFLILAVWAALTELNTGTFYLAAVAAVALLTVVLGFWVHPELLVFVFVAGCVGALVLVSTYRRRLPRGRGLPDLDAGQEVIVTAVDAGATRLVVTYRGARWDAVMDTGPPPAVGELARITRRTGNTLHPAAPTGAAPRRPAQETS